MNSQILSLRFTKTEAQSPVVCELAKEYNLTFNILSATIFPRKEGFMVLELSGTDKDYKNGLNYLKKQGVIVKKAAQEIERKDEVCTHCGSCTAVCMTGALDINRPEMDVVFDKDKCSICKICVVTCPTRAMIVKNHTDVVYQNG